MAPSPSASDVGAPAAAGYQVVARRYRPQRFAELVGQEHVARGLSRAIEAGRIGHAYLFAGARGVGKTSAARIYAKALECAGRSGGEPCNACETCTAIAAGQDVDVIEIDAASNRGVDEMRQLRQNVAVRPAHGRYKIYIVDEVHMLTREAFNALLKTLEEPPAHVKFVLCTTEPEKLPITILSRCQRFDFQTVDAPAIARRLAQIVESEGASVAAEALGLIARRAAGSMRDSQSLLEQLLGAATGPIGVDDVHAVIGTGREERVGALVACLAARDARGAIAAFDEAISGGADPGGVLEQVMAALRDALLASVGCGPELMGSGGAIGLDLAALGRDTGTVTLLAMLQIIDHALARMRTSSHAAVLAEMAIVRLASLDDLEGLADAVARVAAVAPGQRSPVAERAPAAHVQSGGRIPPGEKKKADLTAAAAGESAGAVSIGDNAAGQDEPVEITRGGPGPEAGSQRAPEPGANPPVDRAAVAEPAVAAGGVDHSAGEPLEVWRQATDTLSGLAVDFAHLAVRAAWRDGLLEVVLPPTSGGAASFLRRPEVSASITRALQEICGREVRHGIIVEVAARPAAGASRVDDPPEGGERTPRTAPSQAALVREVATHPLVVRAQAVFDAAIRKVEPPRQRSATAVAHAGAGGDHGMDDEPPQAGGSSGGSVESESEDENHPGAGDG